MVTCLKMAGRCYVYNVLIYYTCCSATFYKNNPVTASNKVLDLMLPLKIKLCKNYTRLKRF